MSTNLKQAAQKILGVAGITVNGSKPWDIQIYDERFYKNVLRGGKRALAKTYADGWWDTKDTMFLHVFFEKILQAGGDKSAAEYLGPWAKIFFIGIRFFDKLFNRQSIRRSKKVGQQHYDIGNGLYERMLDRQMIYSCARFNGMGNLKDLDRAQLQKLETSFQKICPWSGMRIVDIGCGWGGALKFAFKKYGAHGVGVTISSEQVALAKKRCAGLPIEIMEQDYRNLTGEFDAAVSFGMAEHVGKENHRGFYQKISSILVPGGRFLYHAIGKDISEFTYDPFIGEEIFPGGELLSLAQMVEPSEGIFKVENVENIGLNYHPTLICWDERFMHYWQEIKALGSGRYDDRFRKIWHYYLNYCASAFITGHLQVYQIVFLKPKVLVGTN